jgi:hypothetical protein
VDSKQTTDAVDREALGEEQDEQDETDESG